MADSFAPRFWLERLAGAAPRSWAQAVVLPASYNNPFMHLNQLARVVVAAVAEAR